MILILVFSKDGLQGTHRHKSQQVSLSKCAISPIKTQWLPDAVTKTKLHYTFSSLSKLMNS